MASKIVRCRYGRVLKLLPQEDENPRDTTAYQLIFPYAPARIDEITRALSNLGFKVQHQAEEPFSQARVWHPLHADLPDELVVDVPENKTKTNP